MKRFLLTKAAERDLDQIKEFLVDQAGPTITRRVLKDIRKTIVQIGTNPGIWHVREDLTDRPLKFWPIYSYLIVYDPASKPVQIVRILHGKRDVEQILH